jgi:hypothetical protein
MSFEPFQPLNPLTKVVPMMAGSISLRMLPGNGFLVVLIFLFALALLLISKATGSTLDEKIEEKTATLLADRIAVSRRLPKTRFAIRSMHPVLHFERCEPGQAGLLRTAHLGVFR